MITRREIIFAAAALLAGIGAALLAAYGTWGVAGEWQWARREAIIVAHTRWWAPLLPAAALIALSMWLMRRCGTDPPPSGACRGVIYHARSREGAMPAPSGAEGNCAPTVGPAEPRRLSRAWAAAFVTLAFALQAATLAIVPAATARAGAVILSPVATTYFGEAARVEDMREFLADYAERMPTFAHHAQTYPPGPIVYFWLVRGAVQGSAIVREAGAGLIGAASGMAAADLAQLYGGLYQQPVSESDAVAAILSAWLLGLLGCLAVVPLYLLARERWGDRAAVCAGALTASVPSLILFTPSISQLVAVETAVIIYLFHRAWSRGSAAWAAAAGAAWALAALTSLAMLALPLLLAAWAVIERITAGPCPGTSGRSSAAAAGGGCAAALAVFALAYIGLGIDFPAIVRSALGAHREVITQAFARTYWRWLGWNLFDFWMFMGAGLGLWLLRQMGAEAAGMWGRRPRVSPPARTTTSDCATGLLWAVVVTVIALDLSGVVRAEVGRIWMFLMLPAAAAAGRFVAARERADLALAALLAAQLLQIAVFQRHLALFVVL